MIHKKVLELISDAGSKFEQLKPDQLCWIGDGVIRSNNESNALHELAHFLVAPKSRKRSVNFGLGHCPDDNRDIDSPMTIKPSNAQKEEELASVLGILYEKELNLKVRDYPLWKATYSEHGWHDHSSKMSFEDVVDILLKKGYLNSNKTPKNPKEILCLK